MKELAVLLLVAAVAAEGPYAPSGWKPDGPAFELPSRPNHQAPQSPFIPVDPRNPSFRPDVDDVTVQGLPVTEVTREFSQSPVSGLQYDGISINAALQSLNQQLHGVQFQKQVEQFNDLEKQRYEFSFTPLQTGQPDKPLKKTTQTQAPTTTEANNGNDILDVNRPSPPKRDDVEVEVTKQRIETYPPEAFLAPLTQVSFLSNPGDIFRVPITQQLNQNVLPANYASLGPLTVDPTLSQLQEQTVFPDRELLSKGFLVPDVPEQRTGFIIAREPVYSQYQQQTPVFLEPLTIQPTNEAVPITQAQPALTIQPQINQYQGQRNNENVQAKEAKQNNNKPEKIRQQPNQPNVQSQEDQAHQQAEIIHNQQLQELERQVEQYKEAQNIRAQLIQAQLQQAQLNQAQQVLQQQHQNAIPVQTIPVATAPLHQAPLQQIPANQVGYQVQINHATPQLLVTQPIQPEAASVQASLEQQHFNSLNQMAQRNQAAKYQQQLNQYHKSNGNQEQFDRIQQEQQEKARQDALNEQGQQKQVELYLQQLNNAQLEQIRQAEAQQVIQARVNQEQHLARVNQQQNVARVNQHMAQRNRQPQINKGRPQSQKILMKLGPRPTHQKIRNKENLSDESSRERVNSKAPKHWPGSSQNSANQPEEIEFHLQQPARSMLPLQPQYFQDDSGPPQPVFYRVQDTRTPQQSEVSYQRQKHEQSRESFQPMAQQQPQLLQGEVLYQPYQLRDSKVPNAQNQFFSNQPMQGDAVFYLSRQEAAPVNVNQNGVRMDPNGGENDGSVAIATATAFGSRTRPRVMNTQYGPPQGAVLEPSKESAVQSHENSKEMESSASKMMTRRKHARMRSTRVRPLYVEDDTGHFVMA
ncbi:putative mediator of RNA polymerase II transcription subunit 12 [Plutella xylostella]|uniref:putative mediator of RNA polymerase II transcription subunit 12 n=1 Tax=Plutella xylostella TaxID=51655 RepID=UPI002032D9ED|nr:putative mediator of RNA polymerase II transcription subunit 12 [Plutella xylostella]